MLQSDHTLAKFTHTSPGTAPHVSASSGEPHDIKGVRKGGGRRGGAEQHVSRSSGSSEDAPLPVTPVRRHDHAWERESRGRGLKIKERGDEVEKMRIQFFGKKT
jgi:hypothetical protein